MRRGAPRGWREPNSSCMTNPQWLLLLYPSLSLSTPSLTKAEKFEQPWSSHRCSHSANARKFSGKHTLRTDASAIYEILVALCIFPRRSWECPLLEKEQTQEPTAIAANWQHGHHFSFRPGVGDRGRRKKTKRSDRSDAATDGQTCTPRSLSTVVLGSSIKFPIHRTFQWLREHM
jgi:hypothetical protein